MFNWLYDKLDARLLSDVLSHDFTYTRARSHPRFYILKSAMAGDEKVRFDAVALAHNMTLKTYDCPLSTFYIANNNKQKIMLTIVI